MKKKKTAHEYKTFNYKGDTKQEVLIEKSGWSSMYCVQTVTGVQPRSLQQLCTINLSLFFLIL
jgi:hypothetical protein